MAIPPARTESASGTEIRNVNDAPIIDKQLVGWTLRTGGKIAREGVVRQETSGVVRMTYVNHVLWQLNGSGDWYSWKTMGGWAGPVRTGPVATPPPVIPPPPVEPPPVVPPPINTGVAAILVQIDALGTILTEVKAEVTRLGV